MAAAVKLKLWPHLPRDSPGFLRTAVETSGKERESKEKHRISNTLQPLLHVASTHAKKPNP